MEDPLGLAGREVEVSPLPKGALTIAEKEAREPGFTKKALKRMKHIIDENKAAIGLEALRAARLQKKWDSFGE